MSTDTLPRIGASRLQNFVATLRLHGNEADTLNLDQLAQYNPWTSADELLVEFRLQENGSRKLPEEIFASSGPLTQSEEEGE